MIYESPDLGAGSEDSEQERNTLAEMPEFEEAVEELLNFYQDIPDHAHLTDDELGELSDKVGDVASNNFDSETYVFVLSFAEFQRQVLELLETIHPMSQSASKVVTETLAYFNLSSEIELSTYDSGLVFLRSLLTDLLIKEGIPAEKIRNNIVTIQGILSDVLEQENFDVVLEQIINEQGDKG